MEYFTKTIKELMMKYTTYFIMDLVEENEKKSYQIISALKLEEIVWIQNIDHALIHNMSIKKGFERKKSY